MVISNLLQYSLLESQVNWEAISAIGQCIGALLTAAAIYHAYMLARFNNTATAEIIYELQGSAHAFIIVNNGPKLFFLGKINVSTLKGIVVYEETFHPAIELTPGKRAYRHVSIHRLNEILRKNNLTFPLHIKIKYITVNKKVFSQVATVIN